MHSTRRYLPMLAVGLVFFLASPLSGANEQQEFTSNLGFYNPCNTEPGTPPVTVEVSGPTHIVYHENSIPDNPHVAVQFQIHADGQDSFNTPYRTNLEASGQFDSVAPVCMGSATRCYDVPFHSVWTGEGAPSFRVNGRVRIFLTNGALDGASIVSVDEPICAN